MDRKWKHQMVLIIVIVIVVVIAIAAFAFLVLISVSTPGPTGTTAPKTLSMSSTGSGTLGTPSPYSWALTSCVTATPCNTYNYTVSASSGLTTDQFGIKLMTTSGTLVPDNWIAVIWSFNGTQPEALWNSSTSINTGWTCLSGLTCPVNALQDAGLLVITPHGMDLAGTGDTLAVYGLGSTSVSGEVTF
jgi:hypothetical protein